MIHCGSTCWHVVPWMRGLGVALWSSMYMLQESREEGCHKVAVQSLLVWSGCITSDGETNNRAKAATQRTVFKGLVGNTNKDKHVSETLCMQKWPHHHVCVRSVNVLSAQHKRLHLHLHFRMGSGTVTYVPKGTTTYNPSTLPPIESLCQQASPGWALAPPKMWI